MARRAELRYDIVYNVTGEDKLGRVETLTESILQNNRLLEAQAKKRGSQTAQESQAVERNNQVLEKRILTLQRIRQALDSNDPKYIRATALERKLTEEINRSTNAQQKYNSQKVRAARGFEFLQNKIRETGVEYRELQAKVRANINTNAKADLTSEKLGLTIASLEDEIRRFSNRVGVSEKQVLALKSALASTINSGTGAIRSIQGIGSAFTGTTKVNSSANQLLLSFGDIAQDSAQFSFGFAQGARAIGNNIAFASEQVLILTQKMEANKKGSATLKGVFKELGTQLMGPVGIIVAINAAITVVTMLAQRQERLKRQTEKTTDTLNEQAQALSSLVSSYSLAGESFGDLTGFTNAIRIISDTNKQITALVAREAELVNMGYKRMESGAIGFYGAAAAYNEEFVEELAGIRPRIDSLGQGIDGLKSRYSILEGVQQDVLDKFIELSKEEQAAQLRSKALRQDVEANAKGGREYFKVIDEIARITSELERAEAERELGLKSTGITQDEARAQLAALTSLLDSGKIQPALYADAVKALAQAQSSLKDEVKEANDELERQQRNLRAGLDIGLLLAERSGDPASVRAARLAILEQRIKDEDLTANEIKLARLEIDFQYFDTVEQLERESVERRKKIQDGLARSTEQINNQVIRSIQGTFQALVGGNKVAALAMLAVEKGLAIGKIRSDSIAAINQLEVEGASAAAKGAVALISGNFVEAGKQFGAVKEMVATIGAIKATSKKNISKVVGIGLLQGAATIASGSPSRGGRGSSGGSSASSVQEQPTFGSRFTEVERRPQFLPTGGQSSQAAQVSVEILADRRQLYALVRQGEEEYKQVISS